jgi:2'-5' RNA ligase
VRIFVALDVAADVRSRIAELIHALAPACPKARWVRTEGMHVTLKFIGETPEEKVERIRAALGKIAPVGAIELRFHGTGFFPHARRPRVFWAGIEASENLAALAGAVETQLAPLGIPREQREFQPHLTLARFKDEVNLAPLHAELARRGAPDFGAMRAEKFHLYESRLKPGGAEYFKLATFACAGAAR